MYNQENKQKEEYKKSIIKFLQNRTERLLKLIKLNAPIIILCREIMMLNKMLPMMKEFYMPLLEDEILKVHREQKNLLGYCGNEDCFEKIDDNDEKRTDDESNILCTKCYKAKQKQDEEEEQKYNKYLEENDDHDYNDYDDDDNSVNFE